MASPTPMGVVEVIVGNVVPGERAWMHSHTRIPDRPRATASPHAEPAQGPVCGPGGVSSTAPAAVRSRCSCGSVVPRVECLMLPLPELRRGP